MGKSVNQTTWRVAILIPCYNEELTIEKVVRDFAKELPGARICVFDNNSSDRSRELAVRAGADVIEEKRQGKGFVVASMLRKVCADYYVMVDGDDTYPAEKVHDLLEPLYSNEADMVVGQRLSVYDQKAFRPLHVMGNRLVNFFVNRIFNTCLTDPMSGYRAFTHELAESLPVIATGFDVETEMTLQILYRKFIIREVSIPYRARPQGSFSKLSTFRDGFLVLLKILNIFRAYKPLTFFGSLGICFCLGGIAITTYAFIRYAVIQPPVTLLLFISGGIAVIIGVLMASIGIILNTLNYRILETEHALSKQILHSRHQDSQD